MGKKKKPSIDDALKLFKDVIKRSSLTKIYYLNNKMLSRNQKGKLILILPEKDLWEKIKEDEELKTQMTELNILDKDQYSLQEFFQYGDDLTKDWFEIDTETLYKGSIYHLLVNGFDYKIPVNRDLLPLKLKKAEYSHISYKVIINPTMLLLKKKFETEVPEIECNFTVMRLFKIL